jgi:hypothetical protein
MNKTTTTAAGIMYGTLPARKFHLMEAHTNGNASLVKSSDKLETLVEAFKRYADRSALRIIDRSGKRVA